VGYGGLQLTVACLQTFMLLKIITLRTVGPSIMPSQYCITLIT